MRKYSALDFLKSHWRKKQKHEDSETMSFDQLIESPTLPQMIYKVDNPNPYALQEEVTKFMQIEIVDILYNEQVCNLIYMQDVTEIYKDHERKKAQENIILANFYTSRKLQAPQQTILALLKHLTENCDARHRMLLESITYGVGLMNLFFSNFTDFQLLKFNEFNAHKQVFNAIESL